jgi:hypothetical protein
VDGDENRSCVLEDELLDVELFSFTAVEFALFACGVISDGVFQE